MKISGKGLELIKKFEGCRLEAYKDSGGTWTIGYGHTKGVTSGQSITQTQADAFLVEDCSGAESAVNKYMDKYNFNQNQFDALVSFAFNIGSIDKLTVNGARSIAGISEKIPAYCNCAGKKLQGLVNRRNAEKKLFDMPASGQAVNPSSSSEEMPTIRKGDKGEYVRKMQQALLDQNFKSCIIGGKKKYLKADGDWQEITESIFRRWQGYKGLTKDSVCGPKSWKELGY